MTEPQQLPESIDDDGSIAIDMPVERTISLEPTPEGYARIARKFLETVMDDVKKSRKVDDRELLLQVLKIAGHLRAEGHDRLFARLLVAFEQNEYIAIMPADTEMEVISK